MKKRSKVERALIFTTSFFLSIGDDSYTGAIAYAGITLGSLIGGDN